MVLFKTYNSIALGCGHFGARVMKEEEVLNPFAKTKKI